MLKFGAQSRHLVEAATRVKAAARSALPTKLDRGSLERSPFLNKGSAPLRRRLHTQRKILTPMNREGVQFRTPFPPLFLHLHLQQLHYIKLLLPSETCRLQAF